MNKTVIVKAIKEYLMITLGVFTVAISTSVFFEPGNLVTGGVTGIGIIVRDIFADVAEIPVWLTNLVLNVPLFIAAIKVKGFKFVRRTLFATALLSPALYITSFIPSLSGDILLVSLFGGVASGLGLGIVFRYSSTTGGSDLAAWIVHHFIKHESVSKILLVIDGVIILAGFVVFGPEKTMYAIIAAYVSSKLIAATLEGLSFAKAAYIISDKSAEIADEIMRELERGATALMGKGAYTGEEKDVLMCVVSTKEIVRLKEIAREIDKDVFIIVSDVREVLGEGFQLEARD